MKREQNNQFGHNQAQDQNFQTIQQAVQPAYDENISQESPYDTSQIRDFIKDWMDKPKEVAEWMINKYGLPQEATSQRLIWHNNGVWKYSMVENAEIPHDFPYPHVEALTQVINFRITPDSCSLADFNENGDTHIVLRTKGDLSPEQIIPDFCRDIAWFNGSITMDRTKGELASRSSSEALNFLSINLAKDIICGRRTVEEAREFYGEQAKGLKNGQTTNYSQGLLFIPPYDYVGNPGYDLGLNSDNSKDKN